jgi:DNA-directed RNA polymerase III subunit RPC3
LVQAGLIYHYTSTDGRTFYEANAQNTYWLVRSGKVIDVVRKRYGKVAAAVTTQLLLLGHASIGHLTTSSRASCLASRSSHDIMNGSQSTNHVQPLDLGQDGLDGEIDYAIRILIKHGLICRLRKAHYQTEADNLQMAEEKLQVRASVSVLKGTKAREESDSKVRELMEMHKRFSIDLGTSSEIPLSRKRKTGFQDEGPTQTKRLRLKTRSTTQEDEMIPSSFRYDEDDMFNHNLVVRLNYAKVIVLCRNSNLTSMVASTYGKKISKTYGQILRQREADPIGILADPSSLGNHQLRLEISHTVREDQLAHDLADSLTEARPSESRPRAVNGHVNGFTHKLATEVRSHLEILCESPSNFLSRSAEHTEKYVFRSSEVCNHLRNVEILRIIAARFDKHAIRIVRALLDKGRVDEKHLQEIVLMPVKEVRQILAKLQQAGFVELQEVPREAQRQPSRTIYLWFYDPDRVGKMLVMDTYKCMARCMQRMNVEREKLRATIEKSERSDVSGQEEKMLARAELEALKAWRRKEARLLGELARLDELIFVLRDF